MQKKNADIIQINNVRHVLSAWILYHIFVDREDKGDGYRKARTDKRN